MVNNISSSVITVLGIGGAGMEIALDVLRANLHDEVFCNDILVQLADISTRDINSWEARLPGENQLLQDYADDTGLKLPTLQAIALGSTTEGAAKNPLSGTYYGLSRFSNLNTSLGLEQDSDHDAYDIAARRLIGNARQANYYFYALFGGTGSGVAPELIRARRERTARAGHIAVGIFDPLPESQDGNRVNDLWGLVRGNEYSDLLLLVENRIDTVEQRTTAGYVAAEYRQVIGLRGRLQSSQVQAHGAWQIANEHLARVISLLSKGPSDFRDLLNMARASMHGPEPKVVPNWAIPCLYPLDRQSVSYSKTSEREISYAFMAGAAIMEGALCTGMEPETARFAFVFCQVPSGESEADQVVVETDVEAVVSDLTGLETGRIRVFIFEGSDDGAQVAVLLINAQCDLFRHFSNKQHRNLLKQTWQHRIEDFHEFENELHLQNRKDQAVELVYEETKRVGNSNFDLFEYYDHMITEATTW
jgi:hypothetical protein